VVTDTAGQDTASGGVGSDRQREVSGSGGGAEGAGVEIPLHTLTGSGATDPADAPSFERPCEHPQGVEWSCRAWRDVPGPAAEQAAHRCRLYASADIRALSVKAAEVSPTVTPATRRWLDTHDHRGWVWLSRNDERKRIVYGAAEIAFLEQHGLRWDDTPRRGRGKARPGAGDDVTDSGIDSDAALDPGDPVPLSRSNHLRWLDRLESHSEAGYVYLARWARAIRLRRVPFGERRRAVSKTPPLPTAKGWPRFSVKLLSPEGRAKRELENVLDQFDARRERKLGERVLMKDLARSDRRGWAAQIAAHQADRLLARRRTLERVRDDAFCHLEHGADPVAVRQHDDQRLTDTIDDAAQQLPRPIFDALFYVLNAREPDGRLAATENVLTWIAQQWGLKTDIVRGILAEQMTVFRKPLQPWSSGRTGGWVASGVPDPFVGPTTVYALFADPERAEPANGRRSDHDRTAVFGAVILAGEIAARLLSSDPITAAAVHGWLRDDVHPPAEIIAGGIHRAAAYEISLHQAWFDEQPEAHGHGRHARRPAVPDLAKVDAIVIGRRPAALEAVCLDVAALAYSVPRKALDALVKKAVSAK
jgi:hypothetical protein